MEQTEESVAVSYAAAGSSAWKKAYDPVYVTNATDASGKTYTPGCYTTSITDLLEDTEYQVRVVISDGEICRTNESSILTWNSKPEIAREATLADLGYTGNGALTLDGSTNTSDGWLKISGGTINGGKHAEAALSIIGAKNIILENVTITGGKNHGVWIDAGSSQIRLINCDISGWGRTGTLTNITTAADTTTKVAYVDAEGDSINYDAGIRVWGSQVTVERCYIHAPSGTSTPWSGSGNGLEWTASHPKGMCGIFAKAVNSVVRYNDIVGSEEHRFNDGIESYGNSKNYGGFAKDSDIYGNMIAFGQDDGVEMDGGAQNLRFYNNRITNFYSGISTATNVIGPSFVFNNVVHHMRDGSDIPNLAMKNGGEGSGITHIFYNTFVTEQGRRDYGIASVGGYNAVSRNNIILGGQAVRGQVTTKAVEGFEAYNSFDYDLLANWNTTDNVGVISMETGVNKEENALLGMPEFVDFASGCYGLDSGSLGFGAAVKVDGFAGSNMGAIDKSSTGLIPIRPMTQTADKYVLTLSSGADGIVTLSSAGFSEIQTNDDNITATADGNILTITATGAKGNDAMCIVRYADGTSVPVLVRIR